MLATAGSLPAGQDAYAFELKWDGVRAIAHWDGSDLRLQARSLRDITPTYPELGALGPDLGPQPAVLDGEIVAFDDQGVPSFERLQERMHVGDPPRAAERARRVPVCYLAFDLLHLGDHATMALPWTQRRARLVDLGLGGPAWATPPAFPGVGDATLEAARRRRLEGVVAKRLDSAYLPGTRSRAWVKVRLVAAGEFVVGGWLPGTGSLAGHIGALLVGLPTGDGRLSYAGAVGTGFTEAERRRLGGRLAPLVRRASPFRTPVPRPDAVFVDPTVVVEVAYRERTVAGVLRHPAYKGERVDKSPGDVNTDDRVGVDVQPPRRS